MIRTDFHQHLRAAMLAGLAVSVIGCSSLHIAPDGGSTTKTDSGSPGAVADSGSDAGTDVDAGDAGPVIGAPTGGEVGSACSADGMCSDGTTPACLTAAENYPNGYCSGDCRQDSDCGSEGACINNLLPVDGGYPANGCMRKCNSATDCQTGYLCASDFGPSLCLPDDCRFVPEICMAGTACDPTNGMCVAPASSGYPGAFDAPPQVTSAGGPVLKSPKIVAVFFQNDDMAEVAQIEQFYSGVGSSDFWSVASEYGVGPATAKNVIVHQNAPATISDDGVCAGDSCSASPLQTWLNGVLANVTLPSPDANTVYVLNYPATTTITSGGAPGCQNGGWAGYHSDYMDGLADIAYAVVPRCGGYGSFTDVDALTTTAAHELMEASTDPYPNDNPAFVSVDAPHLYFDEANYGSEVGDMCQDDYQAYLTPKDFPFMIQRIWSNKAAVAGHDPCQPEYPAEVYFNAVPELSTSIAFNYYDPREQVVGVSIPIGSTATVPVQLYSDYPTAEPFNVLAVDYNSLYTGDPTQALLDITQDKMTGKNGDVINLTIKAVTAGNGNTNGQVNNTELFILASCSGPCNDPGSFVHQWFGIVGN